MQRRSFFGVVFGGFLASVASMWRRPRGASYVHDAWFKGDDPRYRFGFTGFKPPRLTRLEHPPEAFHYHPMKPGFYKPGDTFEIIGPEGHGTAHVHLLAQRS